MDPRESNPSPSGSVPSPIPVPGGPAASQPPTPDEIDAELAALADLPLAAHVEVFAAIHQRLAASLAVTGQPGSGDDLSPRPQDRPEPVAPQQQRPGPPRPFQGRGR